MGMAAIGVALWKYVMLYSPENPNYFNRDRFVLSNGKLSPRVMGEKQLTTTQDIPAFSNTHSCISSGTRT